MGPCPRVLHDSVSPGVSLVLDPTGRMGGSRGEVGSACEEFEDSKGGTFR